MTGFYGAYWICAYAWRHGSENTLYKCLVCFKQTLFVQSLTQPQEQNVMLEISANGSIQIRERMCLSTLFFNTLILFWKKYIHLHLSSISKCTVPNAKNNSDDEREGKLWHYKMVKTDVKPHVNKRTMKGYKRTETRRQGQESESVRWWRCLTYRRWQRGNKRCYVGGLHDAQVCTHGHNCHPRQWLLTLVPDEEAANSHQALSFNGPSVFVLFSYMQVPRILNRTRAHFVEKSYS